MKLDFEIDLKPYEQLDPLMKDRILKKGEVIYVRKKIIYSKFFSTFSLII